jgi:hypothetical protein
MAVKLLLDLWDGHQIVAQPFQFHTANMQGRLWQSAGPTSPALSPTMRYVVQVRSRHRVDLNLLRNITIQAPHRLLPTSNIVCTAVRSEAPVVPLPQILDEAS